MNNKPIISIIMNCYNGEAFLNEAINSITKQTFENWELIFFDNNSKDNSEKIVKSFKDSRIKYFKSDRLLNLYDARNLAVNKTNGDYIILNIPENL